MAGFPGLRWAGPRSGRRSGKALREKERSGRSRGGPRRSKSMALPRGELAREATVRPRPSSYGPSTGATDSPDSPYEDAIASDEGRAGAGDRQQSTSARASGTEANPEKHVTPRRRFGSSRPIRGRWQKASGRTARREGEDRRWVEFFRARGFGCSRTTPRPNRNRFFNPWGPAPPSNGASLDGSERTWGGRASARGDGGPARRKRTKDNRRWK